MSENITRIEKLPSASLPENDLVLSNDLLLSKRPISRIVLTEWGMRRRPESIRIVTTSSRRTQSIIQEARSGRMMTDGLYI